MVFVTGQATIDPQDNIHVVFLPDDPKKPLLQADSCFNKVYVPVTHPTYEEFKKCCTTSLCYEGVGYGRF